MRLLCKRIPIENGWCVALKVRAANVARFMARTFTCLWVGTISLEVNSFRISGNICIFKANKMLAFHIQMEIKIFIKTLAWLLTFSTTKFYAQVDCWRRSWCIPPESIDLFAELLDVYNYVVIAAMSIDERTINRWIADAKNRSAKVRHKLCDIVPRETNVEKFAQVTSAHIPLNS